MTTTIYDLSALAQDHHIELADIQSVSSPTGWLTICAVLHILLDSGSRASDLNIIDPSWWTAWRGEGYSRLADPPEFFFPRVRKPSSNGERTNVRGFVAPFIVGEYHWVTVFIDLEKNRAVLYDSAPCKERTKEVKRIMNLFFRRFRFRFIAQSRKMKFVEGKCMEQEDRSSCGIMACVVSCLLLIRGELKGEYGLSEGAVLNVRKMFAGGLRNRMEIFGARAFITPPGTPEVDSASRKLVETEEKSEGDLDAEITVLTVLYSRDPVAGQMAVNTIVDSSVQPNPLLSKRFGARELWSGISNTFWYGWQRQIRKS